MMGIISASSSCAFLISFGLNPSGMTLVQLTSMVSFVILDPLIELLIVKLCIRVTKYISPA
ncbi:hypothetical protein KUF71_001997 [Frankliniella fusca]|uniref:Uncharacterized protein n=1 Tax=Frankliniella fusca TaxID=407009 RepID=A0AAE1HLM2_9NEOP|nr:hypothetical protein KUF71_001997 [Frankliniella fusca]